MTKVKVNAFIKTATAGINKTKTELVTEKVNEFLDEARTEITVQLAQANAEVIRAKALYGKAKANLVKTNKEFEVARTTTPSSGTLEEYINNRHAAQYNVDLANSTVNATKATVEANEDVVAQYEAIEKDLA